MYAIRSYYVFNILLQVMDHGTLTDNNGRKADFHNVAGCIFNRNNFV